MSGPNNYKLIRSGRLIDARGGPPIERGAVLVQGSTIVAVGREADVAAPEGAPVEEFDYPGMTVMPGMVDCHTHHNGIGDGRAGDELVTLPDEVLTLQSARNARANLFSGVTSIRENGPKNMTMFRLRDAINQGLAIGPRMVLCGRPVAIVGGHMGYFGSEVTGQTEVRAMTRQLIKEGADYIKITATGGSTRTSFPLRPSFDVDELRAATDEARKFGKLTATHCLSSEGIAYSLEAGVDMIIHCTYRDADGSDNFRQDIAERIGEQGAFVNPTIHVARSSVWAIRRRAERQEKLTRDQQSTLDTGLRNLEQRLEDCRKMIDMGLKVITGSDSSWGDYQLGNTVYETELLVEAGYTPMQGVLSVTSEAAKALGIDSGVGTLEPGKEADIIIVDGDPSTDVNALWNVRDVFKAGDRIERGSDESVERVRQQPA
ncbi:MAG: amidohydrolase family protein [SAR202 cluster bacterium]|jgi:imidazolonepropionase-like amidohydrolase|nr:amidohydrolase family protein [SAR202 cluster bacterium]MDP7226662.1 amidohydrolase family protein [SAR202 cluster bacterium]